MGISLNTRYQGGFIFYRLFFFSVDVFVGSHPPPILLLLRGALNLGELLLIN